MFQFEAAGAAVIGEVQSLLCKLRHKHNIVYYTAYVDHRHSFRYFPYFNMAHTRKFIDFKNSPKIQYSI